MDDHNSLAQRIRKVHMLQIKEVIDCLRNAFRLQLNFFIERAKFLVRTQYLKLRLELNKKDYT